MLRDHELAGRSGVAVDGGRLGRLCQAHISQSLPQDGHGQVAAVSGVRTSRPRTDPFRRERYIQLVALAPANADMTVVPLYRIPDVLGNTPVHYAVAPSQRRRNDAFGLLKRMMPSPTTYYAGAADVNNAGETPLVHAVSKWHTHTHCYTISRRRQLLEFFLPRMSDEAIRLRDKDGHSLGFHLYQTTNKTGVPGTKRLLKSRGIDPHTEFFLELFRR